MIHVPLPGSTTTSELCEYAEVDEILDDPVEVNVRLHEGWDLLLVAERQAASAASDARAVAYVMGRSPEDAPK